jgi:hypothetical protein
MIDGGSSNTLTGYLEIYNGATWTSVSTIYSFGPSSGGGSASGASTYTLNAFVQGVRIRATSSATGSSSRTSYIYELQMNTTYITYPNVTIANFTVTNRTLTVEMVKSTNETYTVIMNKSGYYPFTFPWTIQSNYAFPTQEFYTTILNITAYNSYTNNTITSYDINLGLLSYNYYENQSANTSPYTNIVYYLVAGQTYALQFNQPTYLSHQRTYTPSASPGIETLNQSMNQTLITLRFRHRVDGAIINNRNITVTDLTVSHVYNVTTGILTFNPSSGNHTFTINAPN